MRGTIIMMYPYITMADDTLITHSHLITEEGEEKVMVHFERPNINGFDEARCELPGYKWTENKGFKKEEIDFFREFLENNAHLIFRYAKAGGIKIA